MFENFDAWKFLAGLGIFLFGMFMLEEAVKQLSGRAFKKFIKKTTTGKIRSIFTGMTSTAILQSSSAVSLMTLAFVGAGIMSMQNGIGVIMGSNIGTTFKGWLVATVGFKVNIEGISLPLIALGGLGLVFFNKSERLIGFFKLFIGIGFLFMGLDYMKMSVESFADTIDLETLPHYGIIVYLLIGFIITAVMQSSSAVLAICLTSVNSGVIFFDEGLAMIIGANMGTTITIILGAIGGVAIKKQVALSHFIFNVGTGIAALITLPLFLKVYNAIGSEDYVIGIAVFHTFFNVLGVVLFFPFIGWLAKNLTLFYKEDKEVKTLYINHISQDMPEAALHALYLEVQHFYLQTIYLLQILLKVESTITSKNTKPSNFFAHLEKMRVLNNEISFYASQMRSGELEDIEKKQIHEIIHIAMLLNQVTKTMAGIKNEIEELENSSTDKAIEFYSKIKNNNKELWKKLALSIKENMDVEFLVKKLEDEHELFISSVSKALNANTIKDYHASSLLLVNGLLTGSNRQLYNALVNWKKIGEIKKDLQTETLEKTE